MAQKNRTREVTIVDDSGKFNAFFKKFTNTDEEFDLEGLSALRKILSNEKAKLLHTIKTKNPGSLYHLSKLTNRDFKSIVQDVKLLERFGFVDMVSESTGKRQRLKPIIAVDTLTITFKV